MKDCLLNTKEYFGEHQIPWQMLVATRIYFLLLVAKIASVALCYLTILEEKVIAKWFTNSNCISWLTYFHNWVKKFNLDLGISPNNVFVSSPITQEGDCLCSKVKCITSCFMLWDSHLFPFHVDFVHWQRRHLSRSCYFSGSNAHQCPDYWSIPGIPWLIQFL